MSVKTRKESDGEGKRDVNRRAEICDRKLKEMMEKRKRQGRLQKGGKTVGKWFSQEVRILVRLW